jgi:dihydroflavonol-4-reductase
MKPYPFLIGENSKIECVKCYQIPGKHLITSYHYFNLIPQGINFSLPVLPHAYSVMSDVRDVAAIHVAALENENANGKRFIVTTEEPHAIQEIAQILKSNGYEKVSTRQAPTFLLKFMAKFNDEMKGMLPFLGNTIEADVTSTMKTFNWKPVPFEKTVLDTAKSVEKAIKK